ncbi:hypothetical protein HDV00_000131 [Rhizophlyctis rosea]|nr:hypothetical protein HDV00_000131 [Rhizophlyctis rosea]
MPYMMPTSEEFAAYVGGQLGITNDDHIVVYDSQGIYSAPRVWWMFRAFGHENVSVLNGGLPKWIAEGRPTVSESQSVEPKVYKAELNQDMIVDFNDLLAHVIDFGFTENYNIMDARPLGKFQGVNADPTTNNPGHIPTSKPFPREELVDPDTHTLIPPEHFKLLLGYRAIDIRRPVVTVSNMGISAAVINLALEVIGKVDNVKLYDGGFREWSSRPKAPVKQWAYDNDG